jgi:hypothetical protein
MVRIGSIALLVGALLASSQLAAAAWEYRVERDAMTGKTENNARLRSISAVLLVAWAIAGVSPQWTRRAGVAAQGFALLGTLLGLSMIFIGPGPQTMPDLVYHIAIAAVLAAGLVMAGRAREKMLPVSPRRSSRRRRTTTTAAP